MNVLYSLKAKARLERHVGPVYALGAGHQPSMLLSGGSDRHIFSWDMNSGLNLSLQFALPAKVYSMQYEAEQGLYYFGNGLGQLHVVNHEEKRELRCLQVHEGAVFSLLSFRGRIFSGAEDGHIHLLDEAGKGIRVETGSKTKVRMLRASADSDVVYACLGTGALLVMDFKGRIISSLPLHEGSCNAVTEINSDYLVTGGKDAHIKVVSRKTLRIEASIPAHYWAIYDFALSPDGRYLSSGSRDKTIKLWKADDLGFVQKLSREGEYGHQYSVNRLFWERSSGILASAGDDRAIFLWTLEEAQEQRLDPGKL